MADDASSIKHAHPLANAVPMMPPDELAVLAEDIRVRGLLHPIKVDGEGRIVDGRNRAAACEIAGVAPSTELFTGDIKALVVSENVVRRDLKKGQKAMAVAILYPEPEVGGRGHKSKALETGGFSRQRLGEARAVLAHSQALAEDVKYDRISLDEALAKVKAERKASDTRDAKLKRLREMAPDLADLVADERLGLDEAIAAAEERLRQAAAEEASKRETIYRLSESAWQANLAFAAEGFQAGTLERLGDAEFRETLTKRLRLAPERIGDVLRGAVAFTEVVKQLAESDDVGPVDVPGPAEEGLP
jgi:ParB-like chromosome segregation protein Spo0J